MDLGLGGKVAMITGGSHGLGRHAAECLAREGCKVSICGRGREQLDGALEEFRAQGYQAGGTQADVTVEGDAVRFYEDTIANLGQPDILVNNVGGRRGSVLLEETTMEQFRDGLEVNLFSAVRLTAMVLPHMREQGWGRIINISSIYGREHGGSIDYMTAKAGLIAFSKHLALQLAPHQRAGQLHRSRLHRLSRQLLWTGFSKNNPPEVVAEFIARNLPAGKFGWPEPIGETVAFLASDRADLITGACINVDGGQSKSLF